MTLPVEGLQPTTKLVLELTEAQAERLAWFGTSLQAAVGITATPSEILGAMVMLTERRALEEAFEHR